MTNPNFRASDLDFYIGDEAYDHQQTHELKYILRAG